MITNKKLDAAKGQEKPYKLYDSDGLYVFVTASGARSWRTNYKEAGKNKTKTFGIYPDISVAKARELNSDFKRLLSAGVVNTLDTFDDVMRDWLKLKLPLLKNDKHKSALVQRLDTHVSPVIGKRQIGSIKRKELVELVRGVADLKILETAHRCAIYIRQIFDHAVDYGLIESHPASNLARVLGSPKSSPMPCVPIRDAGDLFRSIGDLDSPFHRSSTLLLASTFVRTVELRYMRWSEIQDERFWVIPADRMKGSIGVSKPHVVPLSSFAMKQLEVLYDFNGTKEFVLVSSNVRTEKPISENFFLDILSRLGYNKKMTGHGFRALASTVLNEQSPFNKDVIERQLAHKEIDAVRAAYNRAEYLEDRTKMMEWYSDWIESFLP